MFEIRKANTSDALGISIVNVYTWKLTYAGLIPDEVIDKRIKELKFLAEKKRATMEIDNDFIVATVDNTIVGFCSYGKSRNELFNKSGEIKALYVLHGFQGDGIGKELFLSAINILKNKGFSSVIINCLRGNSSIKFYEYMGAKVVSEQKDEIYGEVIIEDILYLDW